MHPFLYATFTASICAYKCYSELLFISLFKSNVRLHEDDLMTKRQLTQSTNQNVMDGMTISDPSNSSSVIRLFDDLLYTGVQCTRHKGRNLVVTVSSIRSAEKCVFIAWASMVDVFDASGNIIDTAVYQNIRCIVRTANRNIDAGIIGLHRYFQVHRCNAQR